MRLGPTSVLPLFVTVVAGVACGTDVDGPPEMVIDQTACAHCSMLISEPRYAAAYRVAGVDKAFDDIGCMLSSLHDEPDRATARLWFRDVRDGAWIAPEQATFVRAASLRTPMAGGIVATADAAEVGRLTASFEASVYPTLEALLADPSVPWRAGQEGRSP